MTLIGKTIDRYHILEQLGLGGMATVYKAYDTRLERDVAIKIIRTDAFAPAILDRLLKRFEREAKAMARLDHLHIVKVHDYGEYEGSPYLVMPYLPGGTLKQYTGKAMPYRKAYALLAPIADALAYAHQEGMIHRDVKPSNILLTKSGNVMLTDFGIAKMLETDQATLTRTGVGVGTSEYMAPEQCLGKQVDGRTDVYALGVVLYELLTGSKPFTADAHLAVMLKQISDPLPRPRDFVSDLPEAVERVLFKALAKQPENRYEDMAAFYQALLGLAQGAVQDEEKPSASVLVKLDVTDDETASERQHEFGGVDPDQTVDEGFGLQAESEEVAELPVAKVSASGQDTQTLLPVESQHAEPLRPTMVDKPGGRKLARWVYWAAGALVVLGIFGVGSLWGNRSQPVEVAAPSSAMIREKDGMQMVYVPAGEFNMGSENGDGDELPVHSVYLDAYWIDKYEVTNAQYAAFLNTAGGNQKTAGADWVDAGATNVWINEQNGTWQVKAGYEDHPMVEVSWYGAQVYCEWAGGGLPTEAEWEKAARGTDERTYPWGNENPTCSLANSYPESSCIGNTSEVGSYPAGASPYGAMDMAGNVWEWVSDWYDEGYYSKSPSENPPGPVDGTYQVLRGGSWSLSVNGLRAANRSRSFPNGSWFSYGFRCVVSP